MNPSSRYIIFHFGAPPSPRVTPRDGNQWHQIKPGDD
jgi:hypothetical protein